MKTLLAGLILLGASVALLVPSAVEGAQTPDPRDSIIIESQYIARGNGACGSSWFRIKVWITNKDSLAAITMAIRTTTTSGAGYATLSRPFSCANRTLVSHTFDFLYPPGPGGGARLPSRIVSGIQYHSNSPDSIGWGFVYDPMSDDSKVPPNLTRALLGEIKFDSVSGMGQFELDTTKILTLNRVEFVDLQGNTVKANFAKGVVNVIFKGDLDLDGDDHPADIVLLLNCVYLGIAPPVGSEVCDVNCDGVGSSADVVAILNAVFLGTPYPC